MAVPTIEDLLRTCERTALHLETRDQYDRTDPMFTAWQAGHRDDPADRDSWWRPWCDLIAETTGRGVAVRRARIVSEPVSEYIQFEYDGTFTNVAAGEDIRWLPRRQATDIALPGNDFWLFDDTLVRVGHFDGDGRSTGHEMTTDPGVVKVCASAFDAVWERAVPHGQYRPS
ncbi:DUF6879 family protein [Dactylosporangium sp. NPDC049525]|uniref:DUF6879 family protein n=1 Tax=Dactylosporangium sp. NPDC049525 TaxID=3154730 RepID=UPI003417DBFC